MYIKSPIFFNVPQLPKMSSIPKPKTEKNPGFISNKKAGNPIKDKKQGKNESFQTIGDSFSARLSWPSRSG